MNVLRGLLLSTATALMLVACGGEDKTDPTTGGASTTPPPVVVADLPASTVAQMKAIIEEKAARSPAQKKISSQLLYAKTNRFPALKQRLQKGEVAKPSDLVSLLRYDDQGRVLSDVKGDVDAGLQLQIEIAGGAV